MSTEALRQDIRRTAGEKAKQLLADATSQANAVLAEAESQAKRITEGRVQDSERLMEQTEKSEGAKARMECTRSLLGLQSRYVEEAFRQAESRVMGLPSGDPALYKRVLTGLVSEACAGLGGSRLVAVARDSDRAIVEDILRGLKASGGRDLVCSLSAESLKATGGIIVHTEDLREYYVNTFESRFLKSRDETRAKVADALLRGE